MDKDSLKRYVAECIGTFALVFFGAGARDMVGDTTNFAGILLVHVAFAFTIAAMIYTLSHISAAIFNPVLTLGFAVTRHFPWRYVLPYWVAQFAGAIAACAVHALVIPDKAQAAHFGATIPKIGILPALLIEIVLTFFLMLVNMASATDKRFKRQEGGLTVGFTILACGLAANSLSGASMNPARSLGPALFAGSSALSVLWVFFVGPVIGALLGAWTYELIRGDKAFAKGTLDEPMSRYDGAPEPQQEQEQQKAARLLKKLYRGIARRKSAYRLS